VFFIFVLLAAALRWGVAPTAATGAAIALWYLAEAVLQPPLAEEFDVTRFLMRTAYLLVATLVLAQLAGIQRAFYTDNYLLSRVLAGLKRGDSFTESLEDVLEAALVYTGAERAVLALADETAERLYIWQMLSAQSPRAAHVSLDERPRAERAALFFDAPAAALVWSAARGRDGSLRVRALGADGTAQPRDVEPEPHLALIDRYGATGYVGVSVRLPQWDVRLYVCNAIRVTDGDLRFLQRFGMHLGPALHSQYFVSRLRTRIGAVERARLARELHDGLIQSLLGLEMEIQAVRQTHGTTEPRMEETLERVQHNLHRTVLDTRDLMAELRPHPVSRAGLLPEVSGLVERFRNDTGIDARFSTDLETLDCAPRTCLEVSRIVREALINVRKHSGANQVMVHFGRREGRWTLSIDDNGRGFNFAGRRAQAELEAAGLGPVTIQERVQAIGGSLTVQSNPGSGARLEISWPSPPGLAS